MNDETTRHGNRVRVAVDGSSLGNPGAGGWSWWINPERWESGGTPRLVSNNAMELTALLRALEYDIEAHMLILSDSSYVINAVTNWHFAWRKRGWKTAEGKPVANQELIEAVLSALARRKSAGWVDTLEWVKGHSGHVANENADKLAREAALEARQRGQNLRIRSGPSETAN